MKKVYLIRAAQFYKIGIASNPKTRLKGIQTGCPIKCEYIGYFPTDDPDRLEKHLHGVFQDTKTAGEWFDLGDDNIKRMVVEFNLKHETNPHAKLSTETERTSQCEALKTARGITAQVAEIEAVYGQCYNGRSFTDIGKNDVRNLITKYGYEAVHQSLRHLSARMGTDKIWDKWRNACKTFNNYGRMVDDKVWSLYFKIVNGKGQEQTNLMLTYIMQNEMDLRDDWNEFAEWCLSSLEIDYDTEPGYEDYCLMDHVKFHMFHVNEMAEWEAEKNG